MNAPLLHEYWKYKGATTAPSRIPETRFRGCGKPVAKGCPTMDCAVGKARSTCAFAGAQACRLAAKGMRPGEHRSRRQACKRCSAKGCMTAAKQPPCTWITRSPFVEKVLITRAQRFARPVRFEKVRNPSRLGISALPVVPRLEHVQQSLAKQGFCADASLGIVTAAWSPGWIGLEESLAREALQHCVGACG